MKRRKISEEKKHIMQKKKKGGENVLCQPEKQGGKEEKQNHACCGAQATSIFIFSQSGLGSFFSHAGREKGIPWWSVVGMESILDQCCSAEKWRTAVAPYCPFSL